jgi:hypothetical protein
MLKAWANYIDAADDTVLSETAFDLLGREVDILWRINQRERLKRLTAKTHKRAT